jgi:exonuclease SbcD
MRLLHTSDWHLGKTLGRVDRAPDADTVIAEIQGVAEEFRPDLVVHSGDLFDHARPSTADMTRAFDALAALARVAPVVVVAGNHDSPSLFSAFQRLLVLGAGSGEAPRVTMVPFAKPPDEGGVLAYPAADGRQTIRVAPMPFVHPNSTIRYFDVDPALYTQAYADQVKAMQEALAEGLVTDPSTELGVFVAHLHIHGAVFSRSERMVHVSDTYATRAEHLPYVTYAAFGHIHKPQAVGGGNIHYAGSPIPIDFGEIDEAKRIVLVEATPGSPPTIESVTLTGGRPLRRVEGTLEEVLRQTPGKAIVDVTIDTDTPLPNLSERLASAWPDTTIRQALERFRHAKATAITSESVEGEEPELADLLRDYCVDAKVPAADLDRVLTVFTDVHGRIGTAEPIGDFPELQALLRCTGHDAEVSA